MFIKLVAGPDSGKSLELFPGRRYLVGRDQHQCDLSISDSLVSSVHVIIQVSKDQQVTARDAGSYNGTFLNGTPLTEEKLIQPGDCLLIGKSELSLSLLSGAELPIDQRELDTHSSEQLYTVHSRQESGVIRIGRGGDNDIILDHPQVSRAHALIEMTPTGSYITDLQSTNGTYLNGVLISGRTPLNTGDIIRVSGYRISVDEYQLVKQDETRGRIELDVKDLSKVVMMPDGEERILVNNVSFKVKPREFVAILGASGSGKTTLLKALMGSWPATFGELMINGANYYQEYGAFKQLIGYVPQDDIVHTDLTVEEVLTYSARLRMPDDTLPEERQARIEDILQILELSQRRSSPVKKLSGGQRKRVSIAVELITRPSIMFLDEPTSGLDPGLERIMMEMMRRMADRGQTIFLVTHATFNIELCDKVLFLTEGGRQAFFGTPREALNYFGAKHFAEIYKMINTGQQPEEWQARYASSDYAERYRPASKNTLAPIEGAISPGVKSSSLRQWYNLTCRYLRVMLRDRKYLALLVLQPLVISVLLSLLFFHAAPIFGESTFAEADLIFSEEAIFAGKVDEVSDNLNVESNRERRMVTIVFAVVLSAVWFGTSNAAREIVKELSIYKRERLVNLCIAPYLLSKIAILALVCALQSMLFILVLSLTLGLPGYLLNTVAFFLIALSSVMMGLTVSAFAASSNTATTAIPILLIPQMILAGAMLPIDEVSPEFLQVIFYFAVSKWGYELIGGGVCSINDLLSFAEPIKALEGSFGLHWWILFLFCAVFYIASTVALLKKDADLS